MGERKDTTRFALWVAALVAVEFVAWVAILAIAGWSLGRILAGDASLWPILGLVAGAFAVGYFIINTPRGGRK